MKKTINETFKKILGSTTYVIGIPLFVLCVVANIITKSSLINDVVLCAILALTFGKKGFEKVAEIKQGK